MFDKEHSSYEFAKSMARDAVKNGKPIVTITSVPCFEFWFLIHFIYTTKPYHKTGKKSVGEQIKKELKRYIDNYSEEDPNLFEKTMEYLETAIANAKKIIKNQKKNGDDNPSTEVYILVEDLRKEAEKVKNRYK